jgi:hypothetical protein
MKRWKKLLHSIVLEDKCKLVTFQVINKMLDKEIRLATEKSIVKKCMMKKDKKPWIVEHIGLVRRIKEKCKYLPPLTL